MAKKVICLNDLSERELKDWFWKHEHRITELKKQISKLKSENKRLTEECFQLSYRLTNEVIINEASQEEIKRLKDEISKAKIEFIKEGEYCLKNDVRKYEGLLLAEKIFEKHLAECNNDCGNCLWLECPTEN